LSLFRGKLKEGAVIAFDDYDNINAKGLVKVVNQFVQNNKISNSKRS